jgi:hypothetical protein
MGDMAANGLTKGLTGEKYKCFLDLLGLKPQMYGGVKK